MVKPAKPAIILIPVGEISGAVMENLTAPIEDIFLQRACTGDPLELPAESLDERRGQHLADIILDRIPAPRNGGRNLGIVDVDIYALGLNFVFGEADLKAKKAVISLTRLRQEYYSLTPDERLFRERTLKEAVHELGHTCGLKHCPDSHCVMYFSSSIQDTDKKDWNFCAICRRRLSRLC